MQYRRFGGLDWKVSVLGFGCMRLPTLGGGAMTADIDEPEAVRMIHRAIDRGVNYVDSAYPYHQGRSEVVLGKALRGGYREKVRVATKSPSWLIEEGADFDRFLAEQMERLATDRIDFYLLHGLNAKRWKKMSGLGVTDRAEAAMSDGRIGRFGFSFHDDTEVLKEIVDGYDRWTVCLLQYNYMDIENQAGTEGMRYAASKGLAVAVMEPLLGGNLADPPGPAKRVFEEYPVKRTPADWALRWLWNQPEVSVVLSGMSTMDQLDENLCSADGSAVGVLAPPDLRMIGRVREALRERAAIGCTNCGYCMPCPNGVDIPANIEMYNDGVIYGEWTAPRFKYEHTEGRAADCEGCGECDEKCPQGIPVSEWMSGIRAVLGEGAEPPG